MASTYVNDLRLEEMATGDQSGTWGDTTNTNLELIAEAFSYATQDCFTTDADATTTIADGATDPARSFYLKVTSSATLTATRALTLAPNTVSKLWIIENATTGSQDITIKQGSGTSVTIENGATSVVYSDGGGATANVADAFADLQISGGDFLVDSPTFYVDSTNSRVGVGTTSPQNQLHVAAGSPSIRIEDTDGGYGLVSGLNGNIRLRADEGNTQAASFIGFEIDGTEEMRLDTTGLGIGTTSPAELLHVADTGTAGAVGLRAENSEGHVNFTTNGGGFQFETGASGTVAVIDSSGDVGIGETTPLGQLHIKGTDVGATASAQGNSLILEDTENGLSILSSTVGAGYINFGDSDDNNIGMIIYGHSSNAMNFWTNAAERMRIDSSGNVGIGTSSPGGLLTVNETSNGQIIQLSLSGTEIGNLGTVGNDMYVGTGDTTLRFHDSGDDIRPADTTGSARDNAVDLGHPGAAFKDLYVGSGIYLTGTDAANYLDDYEEGTWTPSYGGVTTEGTYTYGQQVGTYVKIGRTVTITCQITNITATSEGSGNVKIYDFPFTVTNSGAGYYPGSCILEFFSVDANTVNIAASPDSNSNRAIFWFTKDGTGDAILNVADRASDSADIRFTAVYETDS